MEDMHTDKETERKQKEMKLREELENMQAPEQGPQVYDNAFKTMAIRMPRFNIPLINEMFGTHYSMEDRVEYTVNEETGITGTFRIVSRRPDSKFCLGDRRYHLECESNVNGDIAIRLLEYDWMDAVHSLEEQDGIYVVRLQNSGVLYLRSTKGTPKKITYKLILPGDVETVYHVPIIRNLDYTLDQIFEKQLYMLLPYYIMRYEKAAKAERMDEKAVGYMEDDLLVMYKELSRQVKDHILSDYEKNLLYQLIWIVGNWVFDGNQGYKERMREIMGGQVLEFPWDIEYRKQMQEAKDEGRREGRKAGRKARRQI